MEKLKAYKGFNQDLTVTVRWIYQRFQGVMP